MEFKLDRVIEVLSRTPAVLSSMLGGLSDAWVHGNYGDKTFSPFDVVGHLIHGERTDWMPRARIILEHGESRTFDAFDRYAMFEENEGKTIGDLLAAFESLRRANVDQLRALNLSAKQLELKGTHPRLGGVTMKELIAMWVVHDLNHIGQIAKAMAFQFGEHVGPWHEHTSILRK